MCIRDSGSPADLAKFAADGNTSVASITGFAGVHSMNVSTNAVTVKHDILPGADITTTSLPPVDGFFTPAPYRGAFKVVNIDQHEMCIRDRNISAILESVTITF